jgi:hypothetical protein
MNARNMAVLLLVSDETLGAQVHETDGCIFGHRRVRVCRRSCVVSDDKVTALKAGTGGAWNATFEPLMPSRDNQDGRTGELQASARVPAFTPPTLATLVDRPPTDDGRRRHLARGQAAN